MTTTVTPFLTNILGEGTLTVTLINYKHHTNTMASFKMGAVTLLRGNSGAGKTSILRGIEWCIYGNERAVQNYHQKARPTQVRVAWDDVVVTRDTKPMRVTVVTGVLGGGASGAATGPLTGDAATAWLERRFGTDSVWEMACLQRLAVANVLMLKDKAEKARVVREIAFSSEDTDQALSMIAAKVASQTSLTKETTAALEAVTVTMASLDAPSDALHILTGAELRARGKKAQARVAKEAAARAALGRLEAALATQEAVVAAHRAALAERAKLGADLTAEEIAGYGGSAGADVQGQWQDVLAALRAYQGQLRSYFSLQVDARALEPEIAELAREHGFDPEADTTAASCAGLPTLAAFDALQMRVVAQETTARALGLATGQALTAASWDAAAADLGVWEAHGATGLAAWVRTHGELAAQVATLRIYLAANRMPESIANEPSLDKLVTATQELAGLVRDISGIDPMDPVSGPGELRAALEARDAELAQELAVHTGAGLWLRVNEMYTKIKQARATPAPTLEAIADLKAQVFEAGLPELACPHCAGVVLLSAGLLRKRQHVSPGAAVTAAGQHPPGAAGAALLKEALARAERTVADHAAANTLTQEIRTLVSTHKLEKSTQGGRVLSAAQLRALEATRHAIASALHPRYAAVLALDGAARAWLVQTYPEYRKKIAEASFVRERQATQETELAKIRTIFDHDEDGLDAATLAAPAGIDDLFQRWWTRTGPGAARSATGPQTRQAVESMIAKKKARLAAFVQAPAYSRPQLAARLEARELVAKREALLAQVERARAAAQPPTSLELPNFPPFEFVSRRFFADLTDITKINTAVEQLEKVLQHVKQRSALFRRWEATRVAQEATDAALLVLGPGAAQRDALHAELAALGDPAADLAALALAHPYRAAADQLAQLNEKLAAERTALAEYNELLEAAQFINAYMLQNAMQVLVDNANAVLAKIFNTSAVVEVSGFKTAKTAKSVKVDFTVLFHYQGTTYTDLTDLSDGERSRLSWAMSVAVAKMNAFPMLAVDESLSMWETDLRMAAMDIMRAELPDKAIIIVMQDETTGTYDNIVNAAECAAAGR